MGAVKKQQQENVEKMKGLVAASLATLNEAKEELKKVQKDAEEKQKKVDEAKTVLEKCMGDSEEVKMKFRQLTEDLQIARAKVTVNTELLAKRQAEYDEIKTLQDAEAKTLGARLKSAQDAEAAFKTTYENSKKTLLEAQAEFVKATLKANEMLMGAPALLETNDGLEPVKICDEECEEMKAWKVEAYLAGNFDESKTLLTKATNYVNKQMKNMHSMFLLLKQTQKRVSQLKVLDVKLHNDIMDDIRKENAGLAKKLVAVQKEMEVLVKQAAILEQQARDLEAAIDKYTEDMELKIEKNMGKLVATQQQIQEVMASLVDLQGQITRATIGQLTCRKDLSNLKKIQKATKEITDKANKDADAANARLKNMEQAIQDLSIEGETAKIRAEGKIKDVQENLDGLMVKADLNDDKTKRLNIATAGLNDATGDLPNDDAPEVPTTPAPINDDAQPKCSKRERKKASLGDEVWCRCNKDAKVIDKQVDCENQGGKRKSVCGWSEEEKVCTPKKEELLPKEPELVEEEQCPPGSCPSSLPDGGCPGGKRVQLSRPNPAATDREEKCCGKSECRATNLRQPRGALAAPYAGGICRHTGGKYKGRPVTSAFQCNKRSRGKCTFTRGRCMKK